MKGQARGILAVGSLFLLLGGVTLLYGCRPREKGQSSKPVVLRWWHINSDQPSQDVFAQIAREFEADHPGVTVKVTMLENMEYKPKLNLELTAGDPPDLFHSWGGGGLAEQAEKGYLRDITDWVGSDRWTSRINPAALELYSHRGKVYGFPQDLGAVGFWYNSEILSRAGYETFPADWDTFLAMCDDLKSRGVTPIALGLADRWPVMFYWSYLALRLGGPGLFNDIREGKRSFSDPSLIQAGYLLQDLYNRDYLPDTALGDDFPGQSRYMGDGMCAMQLMGQWALAVQAQNSERKDELVPVMRFAPFPEVPGGVGLRGDVIGGGNGFVVGRDAPDEAVELLEYFMRAENLQRYFDVFPAIPTVAAVRIPSPGLNMVKDYLATMSSFTLYPDQMFSQDTNNLLNEVSARIMLGELSPEEGCALLDQSLRSEDKSPDK